MSPVPHERRNDPAPDPALPERRAGVPDRRAGDRRGGRDDRRQSRGRELLSKYRQPIIGLGLAGAAVPLVNAGNAADTQSAGPDVATGEAVPDSAQPAGADTEDQLASRIATDQRSTRIQAAMQQFGISEELATDIHDIAEQENIDPEVAYGLVRTESTFDERAVSHVGARGLTQVMPRTAKGVIPGTRADQLFDRKTNLRLGFRYLDQLVQKYRGNVELALTAYNRGPGTVDKVLKRGGNPDNGYAGKVLRGS